ncbi:MULTISPECIES: sensor histidine kinase [Leptolyngbya]|nr:HAMP domain-containing sensor histidine kinase [Leptolyngbya sp. UWPOB_LEPTO1]
MNKKALQSSKSLSDSEKELIELKSRFISMASHQLRTPLAVIASSAGILNDFGEQLDEQKRRKHLQRIQTYVRHTTQLLDDILLLNKAETGHLAFQPESLLLLKFFQALIDEMQLSTSNHTIQGLVLAESKIQSLEQSGQLYLDRKLLRQIFVNLISNSIQYSPEQTTVKFSLTIQQQDLVFAIEDQGIGIDTSEQAQVFQPFYRGKNVGTIPGTGLGLAIVQKCVELHQGKISVMSEPNVGTLFTVVIPITLSEQS